MVLMGMDKILENNSCEEFLQRSLELRVGKAVEQEQDQSYMELGMVYFCMANDQPLERCMHYSPTPSGEDCTFRFDKFCRKEESGRNK